MQRLFLNWDKPFLHLTVDFLLKKHLKNGKLDLRNVILTLPGKRAIYRLQELLAERVAEEADAGTMNSDWYPPLFFTLGTLPEQFYEKKKTFADKFTQELAWIEAVNQLERENPDLLHKVIPHLPEELEAKTALGRMFADIHRELASDCLDFNAVAEHCRRRRITDEEERWNALTAIQKRYLNTLDEAGIWDLQTARLFCIRPLPEFKKQVETERQKKIQQFLQEKKQIYLVGLTDMNREQKEILQPYENFITALIFAPDKKNMRDKFDEFGCLVPDKWQYPDTEIKIDRNQIKFVSRYENQAEAVLRKINAVKSKYSAQDIVISVPDKDIVPVLQQELEKYGIKGRYAEGTPVKQTAVFRLLNMLQQFIASYTFSDFAALVRHSDVQEYLEKSLAAKEENVPDILTVLDNYHTEHLPLELPEDGNFINTFINTSDENSQHSEHRSERQLKLIWETLTELTGTRNELTKHKPLTEWAEIISGILQKIYGKSLEPKDNVSDAERLLNKTGSMIYGILRCFENMPPSLMPKTDMPGALRYLLQSLEKESIPPREEDGAIELLGWLEIIMIDVPVIIAAGMNDGKVPSFLTSDIFLPDSIRKELGVTDNRRRYARDAYNLQAVLQNGRKPEDVLLISGRYSQKDSLLPSRLFFAQDDKTATERIKEFFTEEKETIQYTANTIPLKQASGNSPFKIPVFQKAVRADSISVTDFKSYLASPVRYFLERQLGLKILNDDTEEIDNLEFGNIIHGVLEKFGNSNVKDSMSAEVIFGFLQEELDKQIKERFGEFPRAVIPIQQQRAKERLQAFADKQAEYRCQGWRILITEFNTSGVSLKLSDREILLKGRIDRIDCNENTGIYRVIDYKTGTAEPEKAHRQSGEWIDLQLPLYVYILHNLKDVSKVQFLAGLNSDSKIEVGYFLLPPNKEKTGFYKGDWDKTELDDAVEKAVEVAEKIHNGQFPNDGKPPYWESPFDWVMMKGLEKN